MTFGFLVHWDGPASDFPAVEAEYFAAIKDVFEVIEAGVAMTGGGG